MVSSRRREETCGISIADLSMEPASGSRAPGGPASDPRAPVGDEDARISVARDPRPSRSARRFRLDSKVMEEDPMLVGRRRFLSTLGRVLALGAAARLARGRAFAARELGVPVGESTPKVRGFPLEELDSFLTPTERFFIRSHLDVPKLDPARHRIQIGGWVERPYSLSADDLARLSPVAH